MPPIPAPTIMTFNLRLESAVVGLMVIVICEFAMRRAIRNSFSVYICFPRRSEHRQLGAETDRGTGNSAWRNETALIRLPE